MSSPGKSRYFLTGEVIGTQQDRSTKVHTYLRSRRKATFKGAYPSLRLREAFAQKVCGTDLARRVRCSAPA